MTDGKRALAWGVIGLCLSATGCAGPGGTRTTQPAPAATAAKTGAQPAGAATRPVGDAADKTEDDRDAATRVPHPQVVLRATADWDGQPGDEEILLYDDRTLHVGDLSGTADLTGAEAFWMREQATLSVVKLAPALRAVLLVLPLPEDEDPKSRFQLFIARGRELRRVLDFTPGLRRESQLVFPGDGSVRYEEDASRACGTLGPEPHTAQIHVVSYTFKGDRMVGPQRRATPRTVRCGRDTLIACPFVYVGEPAALAGEILRNVQGRDEERLQGLRLSWPRGPQEGATEGVQRLRIALSEQKPERTFLDEVFLRIEGQRVAPTACASERRPELCAKDQRRTMIEQGDTLTLEFSVPSGAVDAVLYARGYYEPLTTP